MEKLDDEEAEEEETLCDLKKNMHVYSVKKLRSIPLLRLNLSLS